MKTQRTATNTFSPPRCTGGERRGFLSLSPPHDTRTAVGAHTKHFARVPVGGRKSPCPGTQERERGVPWRPSRGRRPPAHAHTAQPPCPHTDPCAPPPATAPPTDRLDVRLFGDRGTVRLLSSSLGRERENKKNHSATIKVACLFSFPPPPAPSSAHHGRRRAGRPARRHRGSTRRDGDPRTGQRQRVRAREWEFRFARGVCAGRQRARPATAPAADGWRPL